MINIRYVSKMQTVKNQQIYLLKANKLDSGLNVNSSSIAQQKQDVSIKCGWPGSGT